MPKIRNARVQWSSENFESCSDLQERLWQLELSNLNFDNLPRLGLTKVSIFPTHIYNYWSFELCRKTAMQECNGQAKILNHAQICKKHHAN